MSAGELDRAADRLVDSVKKVAKNVSSSASGTTQHQTDAALMNYAIPPTSGATQESTEAERRAYEQVIFVLREIGFRLCAAGLVNENALTQALTAAAKHIKEQLFSPEANRMFESLAAKSEDPILVNSVFAAIYLLSTLTAQLQSSLPNYKDSYTPLGQRLVQQMFRAAIGEDAMRDNLSANLLAYNTLTTMAGLLRPTDIGHQTFPDFPSLAPGRYSSKAYTDTRYNMRTYEKLTKHFERHGFPQPNPHRQQEVGLIRDWRFLSSDANSRSYDLERADKNVGENFGKVLHWLICSAERLPLGQAMIVYYDQHISLVRWIGYRMGYTLLFPVVDLNMAGPHAALDQRSRETINSWIIIMPSVAAQTAKRQAQERYVQMKFFPGAQRATSSVGSETTNASGMAGQNTNVAVPVPPGQVSQASPTQQPTQYGQQAGQQYHQQGPQQFQQAAQQQLSGQQYQQAGQQQSSGQQFQQAGQYQQAVPVQQFQQSNPGQHPYMSGQQVAGQRASPQQPFVQGFSPPSQSPHMSWQPVPGQQMLGQQMPGQQPFRPLSVSSQSTLSRADSGLSQPQSLQQRHFSGEMMPVELAGHMPQASSQPRPTQDNMAGIEKLFTQDLQPQSQMLLSRLPIDVGQREFECNSKILRIEKEVIDRLDAIELVNDDAARQRRKALIVQAQALIESLSKAVAPSPMPAPATTDSSEVGPHITEPADSPPVVAASTSSSEVRATTSPRDLSPLISPPALASGALSEPTWTESAPVTFSADLPPVLSDAPPEAAPEETLPAVSPLISKAVLSPQESESVERDLTSPALPAAAESTFAPPFVHPPTLVEPPLEGPVLTSSPLASESLASPPLHSLPTTASTVATAPVRVVSGVDQDVYAQIKKPAVIRRRAPPPPKYPTAQALYDFEPDPENDEEIGFAEGDTIEILEKSAELEADGWCRGRVKGSRRLGLMPLDYLEIETKPTAPRSRAQPDQSRNLEQDQGVIESHSVGPGEIHDGKLRNDTKLSPDDGQSHRQVSSSTAFSTADVPSSAPLQRPPSQVDAADLSAFSTPPFQSRSGPPMNPSGHPIADMFAGNDAVGNVTSALGSTSIGHEDDPSRNRPSTETGSSAALDRER